MKDPVTEEAALQACRRYIEDRGIFPMDAFPGRPKGEAAAALVALQKAGLADRYYRPTPAGWSRLEATE